MLLDDIFPCALGLVALCIAVVVVYRLTLHPLARVPGPVLAAATGAYEAYFQLIKDGGGRYWVEIDRLHDIYGPIVRINPWEVHIKDADWNDVYKLSARAAKPWWYYKSFGTALSTATTESDQLHRVHRQPLQAWFSSQNVADNVPKVQATIEKLHDRLAASLGRVVSLSDAYRSLALDVTTVFAFRQPFGGLDHPDFGRDFNQAVKSYSRIGLLNRYFFGLPLWLLQSLPQPISNRISPKASQVFIATVRNCAKSFFNKPIAPDEGPQDVVQCIRVADMPETQKSFVRVFSECRGVILAGNETSATVLTSVTYHALANPDIGARLRRELKDARDAKGASLTYQELRALPYLTGVINEALRTCNAVSGRLTRCSDVADFQYQQYFLPRGTYISISINDTHMDPAIFAQPDAFDPERWLRPADCKRLAKHLQPWGRGARLCVGKELAYTDLYLTVARLFGPECGFRFRLFETERSDWDAFGDYFGPMPRPGGRGLRVVVEPNSKEGQ
ncbi:cytochrome P450, putative [Cordyceps militaris CM01]|uniref:Cytochrome P450, putative n=1 Tax=Cordyceps militaris (strain CM01) TaxID=983644 RepID=G3JRL4_CORMM|nr:cytochrome P450, putative [Cordyceps militaris CM01]EGX88617.1 cytochrome P450, putative [Cordyceps militaris CM01]